MTSFVHIDQSLEHQGLDRAGNALRNVRQATGRDLTRGGVAVRLVIAAGAVLLALANQLTTNEVDHGWMVAWIAFCAIVFGVVALSADKLRPGYAAWSARRARDRADAQFMAFAGTDRRIMQDLQAAQTRQQADGDTLAVPSAAREQALHMMTQRSAAPRMPTLYEAMTRLNSSRYY